MKRILSKPLLALFLVTLTWPPIVSAQQQVRGTVERHGVERYFRDSLSAGTQRKVVEGRIDTVSAANPTLQPGEYLVTRVAAAPIRGAPSRGGDLRIVLPDRAFVTAPSGAGMLLKPIVLVEGGALRYDFGDRAFRGSILIGLEDSLQQTTTAALPNPIMFLVTGEPESIEPRDSQVDHTNLPFSPVNLSSAAPPDSVLVNVRTTLHPDGVDLYIPVKRSDLPIQASPKRIQGFGLESATLSIGPATNAEGLAVRLSSDMGNLEASEVILSADGTGETTIRSSRWGTATVSALTSAFSEAQVPVQFEFPWLFLVVALVGGAVGGVAAWLQKRRAAQAKAPGQQPALLNYLGGGMLIGLIVSAAYAVGINLLNVQPTVKTGQAVVFVFGALGGYLGGAVLGGAGPAAAAGAHPGGGN